MEICETSTLPIPMVPRLQQSNGYIKRKLRAWRVQNCIALDGSHPYLPVRDRKLPRVIVGSIGSRMEICETSTMVISYQSPWYRVCTKAMVISKGSYGHGEFKIVLPYSVRIPYLPVRGHNLPRFMGDSIGPRMEICETSTLPSPMVPRLHQSNGYMKRKLRANVLP